MISLIKKVVSGSILLIFVLVFVMSNVFAQTTENSETEEEFELLGWTGGISLNSFTFDKEAATKQKIGEKATAIDVFASYYISERFAASAGIGFLQFDDQDAFTEEVIATSAFSSERDTAKSNASGMLAFGEFYYLVANASLPVQLKAGVGFGSVVSGDRSIDKCSDCKKEDIDIKGGAYGTVAAYRGFKDNTFNIGLSGRQFLSGDIKNAFGLWFEYIY